VHTPDQKRLQALLRRLREDAGFTQRDLAKVLDVHQSRISDIERGASLLDILVLRQYLQVLGVSLADFVQMLEAAISGPASDQSNYSNSAWS